MSPKNFKATTMIELLIEKPLKSAQIENGIFDVFLVIFDDL